MARRNGFPEEATATTAGTIPDTATAATESPLIPLVLTTSRMDSTAPAYHWSVSASAKPGLGEYRVVSRDAWATMPLLVSNSTVLVPVVPMSMPIVWLVILNQSVNPPVLQRSPCRRGPRRR